MNRLLATTLLTLWLTAPGAEAGKVYKWVDTDGLTHYSARPPAEGGAETVNIRTGEASRLIAEEHPATEQAGEASPERETAPATNPMPRERSDATRCDEARRARDDLATADRVTIRDNDTGQHRALSESERQSWHDRLMDDIRRYCR
ncbi:MAG: DUF4124 domain-containing protein [Porticoccaceae bacterium]